MTVPSSHVLVAVQPSRTRTAHAKSKLSKLRTSRDRRVAAISNVVAALGASQNTSAPPASNTGGRRRKMPVGEPCGGGS